MDIGTEKESCVGRGCRSWVFLVAALLVACGSSDPPVSLEGKLEVQSDGLAEGGSGYILDFKSIPVDDSSSFTFYLTNSGQQTITLQSVTLVNGSLSIFPIDWDRTTELAGGASSRVTVSFIPTKVQTYSGRIQIRSTDEENPSYLVDLKGIGTASTLDRDGDGLSPADGDCNDGDYSIYPGNAEACDGKDNNCDGVVGSDESNSDGDAQRICQGDCDDKDKKTYTGAPEICDGKDNNCDGVEADGLDADGDGTPDGESDLDSDGGSICEGDCDDTDPDIAVGAEEVCDEKDNDCDGSEDNIDDDNDSYSLCDPAGDCNDQDASAHPTYVNSAFKGTSTGTLAAPYASLNAGLEGVDSTCRTLYLLPGTYTMTETELGDGHPLILQGTSSEEVTVKPSQTGRLFRVINRSHLKLLDVTITGGNAAGGDTGGDGGAILAQNGDVTLTRVLAKSNKSAADGGVALVQSGKLTITDSRFESNTAGDDGGAILVLSGELSDSGSTYSSNKGADGGAVSLQSSKGVLLTGLTFEANTATGAGGGLSVIGSTQLKLEKSRFFSNTAGKYGGALALNDVTDASGYVRNCLIQNNGAGTDGGGISLIGVQSLAVTNNTLTENEAVGDGGGLVVMATAGTTERSARSIPQASTPKLISNIIAWCKGDSGFYVKDTGSDVRNNTVFNTDSGVNFAGAGIDPTSSSFTSSSAAWNLTDNPLFILFEPGGEPADDDLHLQSASSSRNSGPSETAYKDPDGSRNDRGAYGGPSALP